MTAVKRPYCEGRKELAHTMVRLQLILFSNITGTFLFRTFGGFLHVPTCTTQIYWLSGAIISETRITNIYFKYNAWSSTVRHLKFRLTIHRKSWQGPEKALSVSKNRYLHTAKKIRCILSELKLRGLSPNTFMYLWAIYIIPRSPTYFPAAE